MPLNDGLILSNQIGDAQILSRHLASGVATGGAVQLDEIDRASDGAISFTGISSAYTMLRFVGVLRSDRAGSPNDGVEIQVGASTVDSGSNYAYARITRGNSPAESGAASDTKFQMASGCNAATATSGFFSPFRMEIYNYANTDEFRTVHMRGSVVTNASTYRVSWLEGIWQDAANAIDIVTFGLTNGSNFVAGSKITLWGIA